MDQKQFNEFQTAIQWVVDEKRRKDDAEQWKPALLEHRQQYWAVGETQPGIIAAPFPRDGVHVSLDWHPVCATGCCVAGNMVLAHGDQFIAPAASAAVGLTVTVEQCIDEDGMVHKISTRAKEIGGLTDSEAGRLFHQDNSAATIARLATNIAHNHGYTLEVI